MGCSGCFSNSQQERAARRIIKEKAQVYANRDQTTMVIYALPEEIKFTTLADAIERGIRVEWVVFAKKQ